MKKKSLFFVLQISMRCVIVVVVVVVVKLLVLFFLSGREEANVIRA